MDIRARPISFSDRPSKATWVTRSRTRRRDRSPSPQIQLADLGGCLLLLSGLRTNGAIPSEPPSLARLDWRATVEERDGGHPFGEPERTHIIPLPGWDAPRIHGVVPARSTGCGPACWLEL